MSSKINAEVDLNDVNIEAAANLDANGKETEGKKGPTREHLYIEKVENKESARNLAKDNPQNIEYIAVNREAINNIYDSDLPACTQSAEEAEDLMSRDSRHFCQIYWDYAKNDSSIFGMIYGHQFLFPRFNNFYQLLFGIILDFFFNILFFSLEEFKNRVNSNENLNYNYTWKYEYGRTICAALVSHAVISLLYLLLFPNRETRRDYIKASNSHDENTFKHVLGKMGWRYLIYYSITLIILSCFFYLTTTFSSVYVMSQWSWLEGGFLTFLWRIIINELLLCNLTATFFYWMARKTQYNCYTWTNYKFVVECMVN